MSNKVVLKDLLPDPRMVSLGKGQAQVYGIDLSQLGVLLSKYSDQLSLFLTETKPDMAEVIKLVPELAMQLIAMGLRAEDQMDDVKRIPLAQQIEILMDIWDLSVPDVGKLKARLSEFSGVLRSLAAKANAQQSPSPSIKPLPSESSS